MKLILPLPPSANRMYRNCRGRMVLSNEAREYKKLIQSHAILSSTRPTPLKCPVSVTLHVYRARKSGDLDNKIKCVLDALQGVFYANDSQIVELHARRFDDKLRPRVEISIEAVPIEAT